MVIKFIFIAFITSCLLCTNLSYAKENNMNNNVSYITLTGAIGDMQTKHGYNEANPNFEPVKKSL